jgi:hypothetical protein
VLWDVRRLLPVYLGLRQVRGEESGDILGVYAMEMQVDLLRAVDCGPRLWERRSGPRRPVEPVQGSADGGTARGGRPAPPP